LIQEIGRKNVRQTKPEHAPLDRPPGPPWPPPDQSDSAVSVSSARRIFGTDLPHVRHRCTAATNSFQGGHRDIVAHRTFLTRTTPRLLGSDIFDHGGGDPAKIRFATTSARHSGCASTITPGVLLADEADLGS